MTLRQDREDLHLLLDRIPEGDLTITRKLLLALAVQWDVAPAESEGMLTDQARERVEEAERFFDAGGKGIPHETLLVEYGLG